MSSDNRWMLEIPGFTRLIDINLRWGTVIVRNVERAQRMGDANYALNLMHGFRAQERRALPTPNGLNLGGAR